jgi:hypothetical protein
VSLVVKFLQTLGRLEETVPLERKLLTTQPSTIEVLNVQLHEILTTEFEVSPMKYQTPCYLAMSIHDPLLRFETTLSIVHDHFASVSTLPLLYRFHQPPRPFTYEELNGTFYKTVDAFVTTTMPGDEDVSIVQASYDLVEQAA